MKNLLDKNKNLWYIEFNDKKKLNKYQKGGKNPPSKNGEDMKDFKKVLDFENKIIEYFKNKKWINAIYKK